MDARVLWALILGFLAGVFLRSFIPLGFAFAAFAALLGVAAFSIGFIERSKLRVSILIALALFAFTGGVLRMSAAIVEPDPVLRKYVGDKVVLEGVVVREPDEREASTRISVHADTLIYGSATSSVRDGVLVIASSHTGIAYGDQVRAEGTLRLPESFETGEGREFDYPAFLSKDGIHYELAFATIERIGEGSKNPLKAAAIFLKQKYLEGIALALPEPHAGLAGGITAGDKRGLGAELSETFRTVSLTHIIVLSGYNIMILVIGLGWLLQKARVPLVWKMILGITLAIFFALITGLASASVRAAAMASIALIGQYSGRLYLASRALALVALAMVVWNPYVLVYDFGFQLSVIATWGLIAFTPILAPRLTYLTTKFNLREICATTLAAQIAVLPLLLYQSGQFSLYALPVNLLALVAIPWAMLFSAIAALAGLALGPIAPVIALPAYALLSYVLTIAELFASLPFASISISAFSAWWLVLVYTALVFIVNWRARQTAFRSHPSSDS